MTAKKKSKHLKYGEGQREEYGEGYGYSKEETSEAADKINESGFAGGKHTEKMHPPQKAMDEATPTEKNGGSSSGASAGTSGTAEQPTWDARKAGEGVELKGK